MASHYHEIHTFLHAGKGKCKDPLTCAKILCFLSHDYVSIGLGQSANSPGACDHGVCPCLAPSGNEMDRKEPPSSLGPIHPHHEFCFDSMLFLCLGLNPGQILYQGPH